jgi:hypothetical protein
MRTVLAALAFASLAACTRQPKPATPKPDFQSGIGQWHASRGPSDPNAPLAKDPEVTEGGGRLSMAVGPAPGSVTPTVGEQPSTIDQAKSTDTMNNGQPATVVAPTVPPVTTTTAPVVNPPGTTTAPVTGPVTGAGPNGPGTGTGPATPTGPGTGARTPTPSNPGPTAGTGPGGSTPGTR